VKLQLQYILSFREPREREKHLFTIPNSLNGVYRLLLNRMEDSRDAKFAPRILSWIYYAARPLSMEELREALAIEKDEPKLIRNYKPKARDISECCRGLVVWDKPSDRVTFTHATVKKFLEDEKASIIEEQKRLGERAEKKTELLSTPASVSIICLTYLCFDEFETYPNAKEFVKGKLKEFNLYSYASQFWGAHIRGEAEESTDVQNTLLRLLKSEAKTNLALQIEAYLNSRFHNISFIKGQTLLHILAEKGLGVICKLVLYGDAKIDGRYLTDSQIAS